MSKYQGSSFEQTLLAQNSPEKYSAWKEGLGVPLSLPDNYPLDNPSAIPFFNPKCESPQCIYSLDRLEQLYNELVDPEEEFDAKEEFGCDHCNNKLKFSEFYTCKELRTDVLKLCREAGMDVGSEELAEEDEQDENGSKEFTTGGNEEDSEISYSSVASAGVVEVYFVKEVPDPNLYTDIEVEEYTYIIDTNKREKLFRVEGGTFDFGTEQGKIRVPVSEFSKMVRSHELNNPIYDLILLEYWREVFVKVYKTKLPVYFYEMDNELGRRPHVDAKDKASKNLKIEDLQFSEYAIIIIKVRKHMNLFYYNYIDESLKYYSADKKEHLSDNYSTEVLQRKTDLFGAWNKVFFKNSTPITVKESTNSFLDIKNNLAKQVFVHYFIAENELKLQRNKLANFFDLILWILFKLNLKSKEELSELAEKDSDGESFPPEKAMLNQGIGSQMEGGEDGSLPEHSHQPKEVKLQPHLDSEEMKSFQNFYSLLWYYFYYDKKRYKQLWKDYEKKFSSIILQRAGLNPKILEVDVESKSESTESRTVESSISTFRKKQKPAAVIEPTNNYRNQVESPQKERTKRLEDSKMSYADSIDSFARKTESNHNINNNNNSSSPALPSLKTTTTKKMTFPQPSTTKQAKMKMQALPPVDNKFWKKSNPNFYTPEEFLEKYKHEDRVTKLHQSNVKHFPDLYEDSEDKEMRGIRPASNRAVIDPKLNVVGPDSLKQFRDTGYMSEDLLNYFINYLKEKQEKMDQQLLSRYNLKTLFFTTDLFRGLVVDLSKQFFITRYEKVKHMTKAYSTPGRSIFAVFNKLSIPVVDLSVPTQPGYKLIVVDPVTSTLSLYDPLHRPSQGGGDSIHADRYMLAISAWIDQEYMDKGLPNPDVLHRWKWVRADCTGTEDRMHSALFVSMYLYTIVKGVRQPFFKGQELNRFISKIATTIEKRMLGRG